MDRTPPPELTALYNEACRQDSDIHMHLPTLARLASECEHVTEMGVREAVSTRALLLAQPAVLRCYDFKPKWDCWNRLLAVHGRTDLKFIEADTTQIVIEPTEMLFIDTLHVYEQLKREFELHSESASKYIVLHDTVTFEERGELPETRGLGAALEELLALGRWEVREHFHYNNGLTVLGRTS